MGSILFLGIGCIFFGLWLISSSSNKKTEVVLSPMVESTREVIIVEISGAVKKPGAYEGGEGSRIGDLVREAEGFSKDVDKGYVASELNLAQKLRDEEKVYIKFAGESLVSLIGETAQSNDQLISINNASQSQLEELDGVGEKRALEIILQRPYQSIDELTDKNVVSKTLIENNKDKLKL